MSECPTKDAVNANNRLILATHRIGDAYEFEHHNFTDFCILEKFVLNDLGEVCLGLRAIVAQETGSFKEPMYYANPGNQVIKLHKLS